MSARGRGRGIARGGQGSGGRGRGSSSARAQVYRPTTGSNPSANAQVTALETRLVPTPKNASMDIAKLSLNQETPYRPGYGTRGVPVSLFTNHFQIIPNPDITVFRYSVEINPSATNRRLRVQLIKSFLHDSPISTLSPGLASDYQTTIITTKRLTGTQLQANVALRDDGQQQGGASPRDYSFTLLLTGTFSIADVVDYLTSSNLGSTLANKPEFIQPLNIAINNHARIKDPTSSFSTSKNAHYPIAGPKAESYDLGAGLNAWRGYFTSVRTAAARLLVNVQVSHLAMYRAGRLDELMIDFKRQRDYSISALNDFLRRVRVGRLHLERSNTARKPRPVTISGLATPQDGQQLDHPPRIQVKGASAKQVEFYLTNTAPQPLRPNSYVTVFDYFLKVYGITVGTSLPVVNVGTKESPNYLPPEVCFVLPAQTAATKLSSDQTANMIRFAVRRPFENARAIAETGLATTGLIPTDPVLVAFGLQINPQMVAVQARILPCPDLHYAGRKVTRPRFGAWNMTDVRFARGATLERWSVLWLKSTSTSDPWNHDPAALTATLQAFHKTLSDCGIKISRPFLPGKTVEVDKGQNELMLKNGFKTLLSRNPNLQLLLVILPRRDTELYSVIKRCGDSEFGVHTQCVVASKFAASNNVAYFANFALKVNLKLGGLNQSLDANRLGLLAHGKTMVVGIDVTHPSPGSHEHAPSVAAVVASIDRHLGQFLAAVCAQQSRQEMVADLVDMLKSRLRLWQQHNSGELPQNILVYRDGVSEGQYHIVLDQELPRLRQACQELYPAGGRQPAISIVVAGKRHHTRFYPVSIDEDKMDTRSSNTKHGTVVDRGITEPRNWDFYLQAHTALQGTARPAHYFVIHDEIFTRLRLPAGFANASDVLEDLTHNLCYMFGRATKAVSYCPPAYYADMVCERTRYYLSHLFAPSTSPTESVASGVSDAPAQSIHLHDNIKDSMFFV